VTNKLKIEIDAKEVVSNMFPASIAGATKMMFDQRDKGVAKYGVSLEDANLDAQALLQHAREEAADLGVYLAQLAATMGRREVHLKNALNTLCSDISLYCFDLENSANVETSRADVIARLRRFVEAPERLLNKP